MDFCFGGCTQTYQRSNSPVIHNAYHTSLHSSSLLDTRQEMKSDNDTLIEDGSGMCWTSGPPGMSDHGHSKKSSEIWMCVARCRLKKVSGNTEKTAHLMRVTVTPVVYPRLFSSTLTTQSTARDTWPPLESHGYQLQTLV